MNTEELVLVLDFGAQYSQLIARKVRACDVYCEILPFDTPLSEIVARQPKGMSFSGGPASVYEPGAPHVDPEIYRLGIPILGICYGHQLMAHQLGGEVQGAGKHEYGKTELEVVSEADLFAGLNPQLICWMSHGDQVRTPPPASKSARAPTTRRSPRWPTPSGDCTGCSFIRKWYTPRGASRSSAIFCGCADARGCGPRSHSWKPPPGRSVKPPATTACCAR
jgi:GMP synthase (glutamine-hydrolysing) A subunit